MLYLSGAGDSLLLFGSLRQGPLVDKGVMRTIPAEAGLLTSLCRLSPAHHAQSGLRIGLHL